MKKSHIMLWALLVLVGVLADAGRADQSLIVPWTAESPIIDGVASEPVWSVASGLTTHDIVADIDLELKALHSGDGIYFLVRFADPDCSTTHRSWVWNNQLGEYEPGKDREDVFALKWSLSGDDADLSLSSVQPYTADVWFWKACRTNPLGYADDKLQRLGTQPTASGRKILDKAGGTKFLTRQSDAGTGAYRTRLVIVNEGAMIPRFELVEPTGSRADIRAKGVWSDGFWTIEFSRPMVTGHNDDVQFHPEGSYRFGVSRFEMAARPEDPAAGQPKYGSGEVSEIITLRFAAPGEGTVW